MKGILFALFYLSQTAIGQVSGRLTNEAGQPIAFANVLLLQSPDSNLVKAALTDEKGAFAIVPREGKYILQISSIGYKTWYSPMFELTASQMVKDFGTGMLTTNSQHLGEVIVESRKPLFQQQASGTIINVESSLLSKGSSVLQVLERSPGIVIDHRNNDISLNGKSGVMVMINGKLMRMSMAQVSSLLDGMSADDIATIELLTTPPSSYDAEGSAGLINIVLKKTRKQGTNGSFSLTAGYGHREKGTGSINLTHATKKTDMYGSYTYSHNRTYSELFITGTQNMPIFGGQLEGLFWNAVNIVQNNHDARAGINIKLNPTATVGGSLTWNSNNSVSVTRDGELYKILPDSLLIFNGTINATNRWKNLVNSIYLEEQLGKAGKINIDLDYIYYSNKNPTAIQSSFVNEDGSRAGTNNDTLFSPVQKGFANTSIKLWVGKMDYVKKWSEKIKLESGVKGAYTTLSSISGIESFVNGAWQGRNETANEFAMHESIGAIYTSMDVQVSRSLDLVAGARYEYAHSRLENVKTKEATTNRRLGVLFPSLFLSKKISDQSGWQLSYTKRISRPSYNDLASYVTYSDPSAVLTGNPLLKPAITNNIKWGYNHRGYAFSLLFSRDNHPIARYQLTESAAQNLLYVSPQNIDWQNSITLQATIPVRVNNWWDMSYGFSGWWKHYKISYTKQPAEKKYIGYTINFNQVFKLPRNFLIELSGWYNSVSYGGTVKTDGFGALNTGIKKELKSKGESIQLSVSDLLGSLRIHSYFGAVAEEAFAISNHVRYTAESRIFPVIRLTYSRSFGSAVSRSQRKQDAGLDEEKDRIRKE